jgi:hypothetical protein
MSRVRAEASGISGGGLELVDQAEELRSRIVGGVNRLAARGARRVKHAAQELRTSPVLLHALAARERGNLEAAFWLLNEEFTRHPDEAGVALHYWDIALSLGRVDIASSAGVKLIESKAAAGEPELAAQHWLELIKEAPTVLVSPAAIATLLPALKARHADAADASHKSPDDRLTLGGYLRRAVRHAVDPRNSSLHPGVALRIFEEGREINPEAARRAAEAALESPNLHEAKRKRLGEWLAGKSDETPKDPAAQPPVPNSEPSMRESRGDEESAGDGGLSAEEIEAAAARLPRAKTRHERPPLTATPAAVETSVDSKVAVMADAESNDKIEPKSANPPEAAQSGPIVECASLAGLEDTALVLGGARSGRLRYDEIQAVAVAEIMGLEADPVTVIDLILNWTSRQEARLEIVRLRADELDLGLLVTRKHALGTDFAALMGEIMERTSAIPLPDPESALGTRISCFSSPDLYEGIALRAAARPATG